MFPFLCGCINVHIHISWFSLQFNQEKPDKSAEEQLKKEVVRSSRVVCGCSQTSCISLIHRIQVSIQTLATLPNVATMYGVVWRGDHGIETEESLKTNEGKPVYYPAIVMRNLPSLPHNPHTYTLPSPLPTSCPPPPPPFNVSLAEFCPNGDLLNAIRPKPGKAPADWQQRLVYASQIASGNPLPMFVAKRHQNNGFTL